MKDKLKIIILTADWCPHCRIMEKVLDNLNLEYKNCDIYKDMDGDLQLIKGLKY